jgi:hypothetical protein
MARNKNRAELEQKSDAPEALEVASAAAEANELEKIDFDAWFAMRSKQISKQHHKEIIKADFKSRGLQQNESLEDFDEALRKYGIKLV